MTCGKVSFILALGVLCLSVWLGYRHSDFSYWNRWRPIDGASPPKLLEIQTYSPNIIWWTDRLYPHYDREESNVTCSLGTCFTTKLRKYQHHPHTRAFIFYGTDFQEEDLPFPRKSQHEWALFHEESPLNNFLFSHEPGISLFNHTATFSSLSDYPLTTQFLPNLEYFTSKQPVDIDVKNELRREGRAPVVYVQSHCNVPSDRDRYVEELSMYVAIDSFGSCLKNRYLPDHLNSTDEYDNEEFLEFLANYKFVIAFENALCKDYVTEKLFRAFYIGTVPIYYGSPTALKWSPNDSVIMVEDFDSPKALASLINELDENDEAYLKYLKYKTTGIANDFVVDQLASRDWGINDEFKQDFIQGFECFVCDRLLERMELESRAVGGELVPPKMATQDHMGCPEPRVSIGEVASIPDNDPWLQQEWIESFWFSHDIAMAVQLMIQNQEESSQNVHDYITKMKISIVRP